MEGVRVDLQAAPAGGATSAAGPPGAPPLPILLPELAQLQWLEELVVDMDAPLAGIPGEWGRPGAFPRLQR